MKEKLQQAAKLIEDACQEAAKVLKSEARGDYPEGRAVRKICLRLASHEATNALIRMKALGKQLDDADKAEEDADKAEA